MEKLSGELVVFFIVICTLITLFLCLFIVWFVYKYQKKQNAYALEIGLLKSAHENAMLQAQVEIQEQTFQNISRDIHDNVGQKLSLAKLQIINMTDYNRDNINTVVDIITIAISDLRNLSRMLNSDIIRQNGLIHAIEYETEQLKKLNLFDVEFEAKGEIIFLTAKRELIIFRILQEALQNIVKHAKATHVSILFECNDKAFAASIADNGTGFNEIKRNGQGLINMKARAKLLGGDCSITNAIGKGTSVKITIPINESNTGN